MTSLWTPLIGRFGNQLFAYCHARARAEIKGRQLCTPRWIGDQLFDLPKSTRHQEHIEDAEQDHGYHQNQTSLIYTRKQVKEWLRFKPAILDILKHVPIPSCAAHIRRGDYVGLDGYVVISETSYVQARHIYEPNHVLEYISEQWPCLVAGVPEFLTDFYRMTRATVLFRANSSFSWWAATLSDARVYSPVVAGMKGGTEQDCEFVQGNWPCLTTIGDNTDLHLKEE